MKQNYRAILSKIASKELAEIKRPFSPKTPPSNLIWFLTERCNLTCGHCFVSHKGRKYRKEMQFSEVKQILDSSKGAITNISFTGGEPLIYREFEEVFLYASSLLKIHRLHISTNGFRSEKLFSILEKCRHHNTQFSIQSSIDGPEEIHNSVRGNSSAFSDLTALLDLFKNRKSSFKPFLDMNLVMTVSKRNMHAVKDTMEFARTYNVPLTINFVRSSETVNLLPSDSSDFSPIENDDNGLTASEMKVVISEWSEIAKEYFDLFSYRLNKVRMENIIRYHNDATWSYPCAAGIDDAIIFSDGSVSICETRKPLGSLADFDFDYSRFWDQYYDNTLHTCYCSYDCAIEYSVNKTLKGRWTFAKGLLSRN